jgi:predicted methyltransferase
MIRTTLAIAMALALAACGQQAADAPQTAAPAAEPAPPPPMEAPAAAPAVAADAALAAAIAAPWRTPEFAARDVYRHPAETLGFFGITPTSTVIEITPGGGWYSEILAPYLKDGGRYIAAVVDENKVESENARNYYTRSNASLRDKYNTAPELYGAAVQSAFDLKAPVFAEPGTADLVLTFRNVHNWMGTEGQAAAMFGGFFAALKPGGVLGVVEHRANADVPAGDKSGYVSEAQVIALAEAAGFVLEEKSEINANPADTKDHPNGVWTLPPVSRVPEGEDGAKYQAIGESDRMTLRFRKPGA